MRHAICCREFFPYARNTLVGFAHVEIAEIKLTIRDVALHRKGESRWAQLPSKPVMRDGRQITEQRTGKPQYTPFLEFADRETRDAFSRAVWAAVAAQYPEVETAEAAQ